MPRRRVVRATDSKAVKLTGPNVRQVAMPNLVGLFGQRDAMRLFASGRGIKQAQFHTRRVL